jgi:hypothetical protein
MFPIFLFKSWNFYTFTSALLDLWECLITLEFNSPHSDNGRQIVHIYLYPLVCSVWKEQLVQINEQTTVLVSGVTATNTLAEKIPVAETF